jgi:hypothetical protein
MTKTREAIAYVKFIGSSENRVPWHTRVSDVIERSACHRFVGFSHEGRAGSFETGDIIYLARLTDPTDFAIFGKGSAVKYNEECDRASIKDIEHDHWVEHYSYLLRLEKTEFVDGALDECLSFIGVMGQCGHNTLRPTQENFAWNQQHPNKKPRNIEPRRSVNQQPGLYLAEAGRECIESELQKLFQLNGTILTDR